jgi:outer membrane protein assembly factor BamB
MTRTVLAILLLWGAATPATDDWPQFMRDSAHTGDASDQALKLPLALATRVQLDDAILSSPAVVAGRVYVVDQMGTAYAVDPKANKVLWKVAPDGAAAVGGNTSSPCVVNGKVYFGTNTGRIYILDAWDGSKVAGIDVGSAVPGSVVHARESIYFQTLEARLIRMSLDGRFLWSHDHRREYKFTGKPADWPRGYHKDQFGGGEVAVSGNRVVANIGCDLVCLEDLGDSSRILWCNRNPVGSMGPAISGEWVYASRPDNDGQGSFYRVRLADGKSDPKKDRVERIWVPFATPAVRGQTAFVQSHSLGIMAHDFGSDAGTLWKSWDPAKQKGGDPAGVASPALSRDHVVFSSVRGEIHIVGVNDGVGVRFPTPSGRFISSAPAIAAGTVYFGSDDGCLYGLASDGNLKVEAASSPLPPPRPPVAGATRSTFFTSGPYGNSANTCLVDDPALKPPFRLRWIAPSFATFKQPLVAGESDVYFSSLEGTVAAYDQATGRLRWRRRLDSPGWCRQSASYADGSLFVPRPGGATKTNSWVPAGPSRLHCLNAADGSIRWTAPIGGSPDPITRVAPVCAGDVVAYPTVRKGKLMVDAWSVRTGEPRWSLEMAAYPNGAGASGCVLDGTFYFSCKSGPTAHTVAIAPSTGEILWRNAEVGGDQNLAGRDGKLLVLQRMKAMFCLSAKDGSLLWKYEEKNMDFRYAAAFGTDVIAGRKTLGWSRTNEAYRADTGQPVREGKVLLAAGDHGCGPLLVVSSGVILSTATSGLFVSDGSTGAPLWNSPGFGSSVCTNPAVANGRCFVNPQFSGRIYCFEPVGGK